MSRMLVGRYELVEKIGEGGMAVVYKAKDRLLNRYVAVKILRPEFTKDIQFVESFRKESQAAAGLQHPNIVSVYDVGQEGDVYFIVMELIEGISLSDYIRENAPLDYRTVVDITKQVASALSVAHRHNIIHRDIKPHNIMLTEDGTAKLGDFGIAKAISDATLTKTSTIIGSVHYFSPEQARGSYVDERSDIYSLGIIMYEMLTGQVPFDGDNPVQVALMHINNEIIPPSELVPGIPPSLEKVVMTATDKFQSNRYRSADEMIEDLDNIEFVTRMMGSPSSSSRRTTVVKPNGYKNGDDRNLYDDDPDYERERERGKSDRDRGSKSDRKGKRDSDEHEGKSRGKIVWIVLALLALVAGGVIFAISQTDLLEGKVKITNVVTMDYEEAKQALEEQGLVVAREDVNSDTIEEGKVVSQNPVAGTEVNKNSTVTLSVSAGKGSSVVPNLIGKYYDEDSIKSLLENSGYELGSYSQDTSDDYQEGQIMSQTPSGGSTAEKGTKVDIVVCSGPKTEKVQMPSLTGSTIDQAKEKLAAAGLEIGKVTYEESNVYGDGYIMWQQYDAGTEVEKGTKVNVRVSKGMPQTDPEPEEETKPEQSENEDDKKTQQEEGKEDSGSDSGKEGSKKTE